ncbi:group II intron maturase-specific domain-containing protein [Brucella sp. 22210]|uniref:group II intron maturase-specific domain-containing protein n=1 Tax=Brucella sp. 22210 TaxID=3453892 RepID=UPI003F83D9AF
MIKGNAVVTQEGLIQKLNPIIRGWAMYHRHAVAKASFLSIDERIWQWLWKWIDGHRSRDFATKGSADANTSGCWLFRTMTISITNVQDPGLAIPFDPAWTSYLAHRRIAK